MKFNLFGNKENINNAEVEKVNKIKEILLFVKELADDTIFEHDGRKNYHVDGTQVVNLLDKISRPLLGLSGSENIDKARLELLEIFHRVLNKAEEMNSEDVDKIKKVISLLNDSEIFANPQLTNKIAEEVALFDHQPQVIVNRESPSKVIEKQDLWEKPNPSLN